MSKIENKIAYQPQSNNMKKIILKVRKIILQYLEIVVHKLKIRIE